MNLQFLKILLSFVVHFFKIYLEITFLLNITFNELSLVKMKMIQSKTIKTIEDTVYTIYSG